MDCLKVLDNYQHLKSYHFSAIFEQSDLFVICLNSSLELIYINLLAKKLFDSSSEKENIGFFFTKNSLIGSLLDNKSNLLQQLKLNSKKPIQEKILTNKTHIHWTLYGFWNNTTDPDSILLVGKSYDPVAEKEKDTLSRIQSLITHLPGNVYWMDKNCIHLGCNDNILKMIGITREEYIGKTYEELAKIAGWKKGEAAFFKKADLEVLKTGQPKFNIEEPPLKHKDGRILHYLTTRVPLKNELGKITGVAGISIDITSRKKMEEDKIAKEAAEAADRAKSEFIANMSHDIRTPLSGVVGIAGILEDDLVDPTQKSLAHDLAQSGKELLNMLNEILDVISADNITAHDIHEGPFNLQQLIQGIADLEKPSITLKKIQFIVSIDESIPKILIGDPKKIHHILLNLIGNAIKFTHFGHVDISVSLIEQHADKVQLQFQVMDTGEGVPPEALDKIFDAFYRVTPSYKGLTKGHGLGLHIAQSYVQLLGGKIEAQSKPNEGSVFSFTLSLKIGDSNSHPMLIEETKNIAPIVFKTTEPQKAGINAPENAPHLLIIEDNPIALTVANTLVKSIKLNTTTAVDGESALELAKNQTFDAILSDVGLPGISGITFTQQLRAFEKKHHQHPTPIVGLTAHAEGKVRDECLAVGMNDVMIKPLTLPMLQTIIAKFKLLNHKDGSSTILKPEKPTVSMTQPNTTHHLGTDLPDTESALFDLSTLPLLDAELAIKELGGNQVLVFKMLKSFVEEQIPQEKAAMQAAFQNKDWGKVEKLAHKMKGGTVYLKLNKLSIACQYMERYHKAGHTLLLEQLYQQMMAVLDQTVPVVKKWLDSA